MLKTNLIASFLLGCVCVAALGAAPTVSAVAPNAGSINGGQTVVITGTNFDNPNVTAVRFGGTVAPTFTIASGTTIFAVTPAHAAGAVSVDVNNGTVSGVNAFYTYTNNNTNLQVAVRVTIPKRADIQWGNGTTVDDASVNHTQASQRTTAYTWIVKDSTLGAAADVATTYLSNDATNNKTIFIENVSPTNSTQTLAATATNSLNWTLAATPGTDAFRLRARLGAGTLQTLSATAVNLTTNLSKTTAQELVLEYSSPTAINNGAGVPQQSTVTLTSTAN